MMKGIMQKGGSGSYEEDAPKTSFKQAFASARKGGEKTFEWNGKKYTTDVAKPAADKAKATARTATMSKKGEMVGALDEATRKMPADTSPLAKKNIMEARRKSMEDYDNADRAEGMKAYKPRATDIEDAKPMTKMSLQGEDYKKGGSVKKYAKGGSVSGRADGIAKKGKTNCKMV
jgi:hypothetical protein